LRQDRLQSRKIGIGWEFHTRGFQAARRRMTAWLRMV
jgi:hypothetical protein